MVCFGPTPTAGTNILVIHKLNSLQSFIKRANAGMMQELDQEWEVDPQVQKILA